MFLISTETVTVRDCWFHQCTFSQTCAHIKIKGRKKNRHFSLCVNQFVLHFGLKNIFKKTCTLRRCRFFILAGRNYGGVLYGNDWFLISVEFVLFL